LFRKKYNSWKAETKFEH